MSRLWMTVGLPRSGKSTWARQTGFPVVSPDSIRFEMTGQRYVDRAEPMVWAYANLMVRSLFRAGHQDVVLDATNISRKRRDAWESEEWARTFVIIKTDSSTCINRAMKTDDDDIVVVIKNMALRYEEIRPEEKGDLVIPKLEDIDQEKPMFRKRGVIISAFPITETIVIDTLEGKLTGEPGSWLITGVAGEKYPCKDDIFRRTYDPVNKLARDLWDSKTE